MFKQHVKEVLREADPNQSLIYHRCSEKVDLLALVKKKKNPPFPAKYEILSTTLRQLIPTLSVEVIDEDLLKDYKLRKQTSGSASVQGGFDMVSAAAKAEGCSQLQSSTVTIKSKTVDLLSLKNGYRGQKIDRDWMPNLEKGEVLGFVDRILYNADEVKLDGQTGAGGLSKASFGVFFSLSAKGRMDREMSYTVPAGQVYAHGFNEIKFQDDEIKTTSRSHTENIQWYSHRMEEVGWRTPRHGTFNGDNFIEKNFKKLIAPQRGLTLAPETFEPDNATENTYENLQQIQDELQKIEGVLQPLSHLPRATRSTLFQRLCQVSEEKDAVTALKEALGLWYEQQRFHRPQSPSACSTLDLLRLASALLTGLTDMYDLLRAVYMLVNAMDQLPDLMPAMIAKCSPDALRALNHLVSSIRDRGEAQVTQPLPGPLQEGGELHGLTEFLCSTDETLQDLVELTLMAGETPGVLLLALCITVRGLHMMQGEQNES